LSFGSLYSACAGVLFFVGVVGAGLAAYLNTIMLLFAVLEEMFDSTRKPA
jgi:hypothetical protein